MNTLMEGITVLNQTEIMATPTVVWITALIGFLMFILGFGICYGSKKNETIAVGGVIIGIIGAIAMIVGTSFIFIQEPTGKYRYECLISEDVSLVEFYEQYDLIKVEGQIWTIKEK